MTYSTNTINRPKANQDIRDAIKNSPVFAYEVAAKLGISSNTLTLHLRKPLSSEDHDKIMAAITDLSKEVEGSAND